MRTVNVKKGRVIPLGRLGESEATVVVFDVSCWEKSFGAGRFELLNQRPGDGAAYPCVIEQDGGTVRWEVQSADVALSGYGKCELIYRAGGTIAKSDIWSTIIGAALAGGSEVPEPWEDWVERVLRSGEAAQEAADYVREIAEGGIVRTVNNTPPDEKGNVNVSGGGSGGSWSQISGKPFNTIDGNTLVNRSGTLYVNTTDDAEQDNTRPITSSGVHVICGNINALLQAI